ncbi:hypothetical protein H9P43_004342 [Blastocladiella emersonii ATCC 22665]|nr:hypothetical protein H9P43_004342 [Blastocladiella emersonii ATCC 22665]
MVASATEPSADPALSPMDAALPATPTTPSASHADEDAEVSAVLERASAAPSRSPAGGVRHSPSRMSHHQLASEPGLDMIQESNLEDDGAANSLPRPPRTPEPPQSLDAYLATYASAAAAIAAAAGDSSSGLGFYHTAASAAPPAVAVSSDEEPPSVTGIPSDDDWTHPASPSARPRVLLSPTAVPASVVAAGVPLLQVKRPLAFPTVDDQVPSTAPPAVVVDEAEPEPIERVVSPSPPAPVKGKGKAKGAAGAVAKDTAKPTRSIVGARRGSATAATAASTAKAQAAAKPKVTTSKPAKQPSTSPAPARSTTGSSVITSPTGPAPRALSTVSGASRRSSSAAGPSAVGSSSAASLANLPAFAGPPTRPGGAVHHSTKRLSQFVEPDAMSMPRFPDQDMARLYVRHGTASFVGSTPAASMVSSAGRNGGGQSVHDDRYSVVSDLLMDSVSVAGGQRASTIGGRGVTPAAAAALGMHLGNGSAATTAAGSDPDRPLFPITLPPAGTSHHVCQWELSVCCHEWQDPSPTIRRAPRLCGQRFNSGDALYKHLVEAHSGVNTADRCGFCHWRGCLKVFRNSSKYLRKDHFKKHITELVEYVCLDCGRICEKDYGSGRHICRDPSHQSGAAALHADLAAAAAAAAGSSTGGSMVDGAFRRPSIASSESMGGDDLSSDASHQHLAVPPPAPGHHVTRIGVRRASGVASGLLSTIVSAGTSPASTPSPVHDGPASPTRSSVRRPSSAGTLPPPHSGTPSLHDELLVGPEDGLAAPGSSSMHSRKASSSVEEWVRNDAVSAIRRVSPTAPSAAPSTVNDPLFAEIDEVDQALGTLDGVAPAHGHGPRKLSLDAVPAGMSAAEFLAQHIDPALFAELERLLDAKKRAASPVPAPATMSEAATVAVAAIPAVETSEWGIQTSPPASPELAPVEDLVSSGTGTAEPVADSPDAFPLTQLAEIAELVLDRLGGLQAASDAQSVAIQALLDGQAPLRSVPATLVDVVQALSLIAKSSASVTDRLTAVDTLVASLSEAGSEIHPPRSPASFSFRIEHDSDVLSDEDEDEEDDEDEDGRRDAWIRTASGLRRPSTVGSRHSHPRRRRSSAVSAASRSPSASGRDRYPSRSRRGSSACAAQPVLARKLSAAQLELAHKRSASSIGSRHHHRGSSGSDDEYEQREQQQKAKEVAAVVSRAVAAETRDALVSVAASLAQQADATAQVLNEVQAQSEAVDGKLTEFQDELAMRLEMLEEQAQQRDEQFAGFTQSLMATFASHMAAMEQRYNALMGQFEALQANRARRLSWSPSQPPPPPALGESKAVMAGPPESAEMGVGSARHSLVDMGVGTSAPSSPRVVPTDPEVTTTTVTMVAVSTSTTTSPTRAGFFEEVNADGTPASPARSRASSVISDLVRRASTTSIVSRIITVTSRSSSPPASPTKASAPEFEEIEEPAAAADLAAAPAHDEADREAAEDEIMSFFSLNRRRTLERYEPKKVIVPITLASPTSASGGSPASPTFSVSSLRRSGSRMSYMGSASSSYGGGSGNMHNRSSTSLRTTTSTLAPVQDTDEPEAAVPKVPTIPLATPAPTPMVPALTSFARPLTPPPTASQSMTSSFASTPGSTATRGRMADAAAMQRPPSPPAPALAADAVSPMRQRRLSSGSNGSHRRGVSVEATSDGVSAFASPATSTILAPAAVKPQAPSPPPSPTASRALSRPTATAAAGSGAASIISRSFVSTSTGSQRPLTLGYSTMLEVDIPSSSTKSVAARSTEHGVQSSPPLSPIPSPPAATAAAPGARMHVQVVPTSPPPTATQHVVYVDRVVLTAAEDEAQRVRQANAQAQARRRGSPPLSAASTTINHYHLSAAPALPPQAAEPERRKKKKKGAGRLWAMLKRVFRKPSGNARSVRIEVPRATAAD